MTSGFDSHLHPLPAEGTFLPAGSTGDYWQTRTIADPSLQLESPSLDAITLLPALGVLALLLAGYFMSSALLLWTAAIPAIWLALSAPARVVQLLLITTPVFPVVRVVTDAIGAEKVSTKGLFLSADDPLVLAIGVAWLWRMLRNREPREFFPTAIAWLMAIYPLVVLVNAFRLESNESLVSLLYYLKWAEYAALVFLIPQALGSSQIRGLLASFRRIVLGVLILSTLFAAYEVAESLRTGSYTAAARFPRASSFFGTLDPKRFAASEDPVHFGVFAMVAGAVLLGLVTRGRRTRFSSLLGVICAAVSLLLCASRAPILAAGVAFARVNRLRSSRLLLAMAALLVTGAASQLIAPELWSVALGRFEAVFEWTDASEGSAVDRLAVVTNSPVFEPDQYWLIGHGSSSYRFIAQEHMSAINGGASRSLYNFLLTAFYDAGPLGLLAWVLLFIQINRRLLAIAGSHPMNDVRALAWGLRGALWGLATASLFGEVPYNWRVMGFFYACCGVCLAADRLWRPHQASPASIVG